MRLLILIASLIASLSAFAQQAQVPPAPPLAARQYLLVDYFSGQAIAARDADTRIEPASLTKLMTAYLTFQAIRGKHLRADQTVPVSERAWRAEGSRMFIEPNRPVTVNELMRGMIVQSGNDACIALAEAVAGSEEVFAQMMNREAARLGMKNTHFMNSTGLPHPQHYTTARDLTTLAVAIVRDFPEYFPLYSIREYAYNGITQPNRNRLLWIDPAVDGMKTGHTEAAGYCLISTARRGNRRLVAVVLGTASDAIRATESQKLLNYGFQFYDTARLYASGQKVTDLAVFKGQADKVRVGFNRDLFLTLPKGDAQRLKATMQTQQPLIAPVSAGQKIGSVSVTLDGRPLAELPIVALDNVGAAGVLGRTWDALRLMLR